MSVTDTDTDTDVIADDVESSVPYVLSGAVLFGVSGWLSYRAFEGLGRARAAVERYEIVHGPLLNDDGGIDHFAAPGPIEQLTDEVSAAAGFLYPFGSLFVVPLLVMWAVSSLLLFIDRRRWGFVLFAPIAVGVIAATASFSGISWTLLEILE